MNELVGWLNLAATIAGLAVVFIRLGRLIERQEQHTRELEDHEARLRKVEGHA